MKTVSTLLFAFALIASVNAQVAKHTAKETNNSGGTHSNYRASGSNSGYPESTNKQTYKSSSSEYRSESSWSTNDHHSTIISKHESNQSLNYIDYSNVKVVNIEKNETPEGGIKRVETAPQIYLEDKKDEEAGSYNWNSNIETIPYTEENTKKVMPEGLSQNTTTLRNNGIRINGVIVTCDDFGIGRNSRWEILSRYEMYDLSMIKRCLNNFPEEDRWIITCDEFEKSSDVRKKYLLDNIDFYNLDHLKNCESFQNFKANLPVETEE